MWEYDDRFYGYKLPLIVPNDQPSGPLLQFLPLFNYKLKLPVTQEVGEIKENQTTVR